MHNNHNMKNQAKAIFSVFDNYLLKTKLGYFITDNVFSNNTQITKIINLIHPNLNAKKKITIYRINHQFDC